MKGRIALGLRAGGGPGCLQETVPRPPEGFQSTEGPRAPPRVALRALVRSGAP